MKEYLTGILAIAEFVFLLPIVLAGIVINLFKVYILGQKISSKEKGYKSIFYIFSFIAWLMVGGWLIYQNQFIKVTYVYACPNGTSKCYEVRADYVPEDCIDAEWDIRGAHGGGCIDPYIERIYFENGEDIIFEYCDMESEDKWVCYAEDRDDGTWDLQLSEVINVKARPFWIIERILGNRIIERILEIKDE